MKSIILTKRNILSITKYIMIKILNIINSQNSFKIKKKNMTLFLSRIMRALKNNKLLVIMQMIKIKINCQFHYKYKFVYSNYISVLINFDIKMLNVDKKWVLNRIINIIMIILKITNLDMIRDLLFFYNINTSQW